MDGAFPMGWRMNRWEVHGSDGDQWAGCGRQGGSISRGRYFKCRDAFGAKPDFWFLDHFALNI